MNTAARLQGLTRDFDVDILLSAETAIRLGDAPFELRDLGEVVVRGRTQGVRVLAPR